MGEQDRERADSKGGARGSWKREGERTRDGREHVKTTREKLLFSLIELAVAASRKGRESEREGEKERESEEERQGVEREREGEREWRSAEGAPVSLSCVHYCMSTAVVAVPPPMRSDRPRLMIANRVVKQGDLLVSIQCHVILNELQRMNERGSE